MSLRSLHLLGSPVLRQHSAEVKTVDDEVRRLVADLFETMDAAKGVGLAANQVGVARRVAVVDADGDRFVMIDPVIIETEGRATAEEGCLSIPDIYGDVTRPERVVIEALDQEGSRYRKEATGLKAPGHPARDRSSRRHPFSRPSEPDQAADAALPLAPGAQGRQRATPRRSRRRLPGPSDEDRLLRNTGLRRRVACRRCCTTASPWPVWSPSRTSRRDGPDPS